MIWPHRTFSTSCNEYGAALLERSSPLLSWVPPVRDGLDGATLSLGLCRRPATANTCRRHMPDPVRLALVGCGRIAQVAHLPAVEKAEGVELVAVSAPGGAVARSGARRYGLAAAYTDQGPVWADGSVEAVVIAAPDRFHHRLAAEALGAGRHVLVEKPLASTVPEAEDLVALVDRTGLTLQVGAMKRHDEGLQAGRG